MKALETKLATQLIPGDRILISGDVAMVLKRAEGVVKGYSVNVRFDSGVTFQAVFRTTEWIKVVGRETTGFVDGVWIGNFCPEGQATIEREGSIRITTYSGFATDLFFHSHTCEQCREALKVASRYPARKDTRR